MRVLKAIAGAILGVVLSAAAANAAPVTFLLNQTTDFFGTDPSGTPLGRTLYDGDDLTINNQKIGEYMRVFNVHPAGLNAAAVTLTLLIPNPAGGTPIPITLQGTHDFNLGGEAGSVSASGLAGLVGVRFVVTVTPGVGVVLTLLLP